MNGKHSEKVKALVDVVLQSLGFEVDPTTEKLKSVPLLLY